MKTKEAYLEDGGNHCPHCGSENISGGHGVFGYGYYWRTVECGDCMATWTEEFKLVAVLFDED
jgi:hypothetical protein